LQERIQGNGQKNAIVWVSGYKPALTTSGANRGSIMESKESKRLVMVGIRRKGEKGFKTRVRDDTDPSPINIANLHLPITKRIVEERDSLIKQ
jgi:hypothetical protein